MDLGCGALPGHCLWLGHPLLGDVGADGLEGPDWGFCPGGCADLGRQRCVLHTSLTTLTLESALTNEVLLGAAGFRIRGCADGQLISTAGKLNIQFG